MGFQLLVEVVCEMNFCVQECVERPRAMYFYVCTSINSLSAPDAITVGCQGEGSSLCVCA